MSPPSNLEVHDFAQDGVQDSNLYTVVQNHQRLGRSNLNQPDEYQEFEEMPTSSVVDLAQYAEINKSKN